ncbi:MAG: ABC transporter permease [Acidobacteriota bacterium]|nr:MAG: ABC transporter permease [Acidobacteriota bacterium]
MSSLSRPASLQISANFFRKLFHQRQFLRTLIVRDLKSRYVGSLIGFFWSVIHPLVLLISYTFVFQIILKVRPLTPATDNFAVFVFCAILPWLYFQETVTRSCGCVVDQSVLIKKTLFPSEILPVSLAFSNLVAHVIGLAILMVLLLWYGLLTWTVVFVPVYLVALMLLALGLGWLVAALQVFLRDTIQVLSVVMVFWFWFTPIFYSVEQVPAVLQPLIRLNPLTAIVEGYRSLLLEGRLPEVSQLLFVFLPAIVLFILGGWVFRNTKREFIDVL